MKSTGVVRPLDTLGRVVLPIELRRNLDLKRGDPIEIFVEGDSIILRKYAPGCVLCDSMEGVIDFGQVSLCRACRKKINEADGGK